MTTTHQKIPLEHIAWFFEWGLPTVRRKLNAGEIPGRRVGKGWVVLRDEFVAYLGRHGIAEAQWDKAVGEFQQVIGDARGKR